MARSFYKGKPRAHDGAFMALTPTTRYVVKMLDELLVDDPELHGNLTTIAGWLSIDRKNAREAMEAIEASGILSVTKEERGKAGTFYTISAPGAYPDRTPTVPQAYPERTPSEPQAYPEQAPDKSAKNAGFDHPSLIEEKREEEKEESPQTPASGGDVLAQVKPKQKSPWPKNHRFAEWYAAYPSKVAKGAAETAWEKLTKLPNFDDAFVDRLIAAVHDARARSPKWRDGIIPNPATWLNQRRWEDELPPASSPGTSNASSASKPWEQFEEGTPEYIEARRKAIRFATL